MTDYQLALVVGHWAYFVPDLATAWGDDWDDSPAEWNAGAPSGEFVKVAFDGDWYSNGQRASAQEINRGRAWLRDCRAAGVQIPAGVTLSEFTRLVRLGGGEVYVALLF